MFLSVRLPSGKVESVKVVEEATVEELKNILTEISSVSVQEQRLVCAGKVMLNELPVASYNVQNSTIYFIKTAADVKQQTAATLTKPQPTEHTFMKQAMDSPFMKGLMENPELFKGIITSNPQVKRMIEENPEMAQIFNDKRVLRQIMEMSANPELQKEMMRNNDRAISNLESLPGGFNHLKNMYSKMHEPLESATMTSSQSVNNSRFTPYLAATKPEEGKINTKPLPNPWVMERNGPLLSQQTNVERPNARSFLNEMANNPELLNRFINMRQQSNPMSLFEMPSLTTNNHNIQAMDTTPTSSQPSSPQEQYRQQLQAMEEMGFQNVEDNIRALMSTGGDVDSAVNFLLGQDD